MLVETIDSETADRIRRGLRKETVTHTVQQGETLGRIAKDYGINVATILEDNDIKPEDLGTIKPGTELSIAPEKKTDSLAWLDALNEEERLAREKKEKERLAQTAKNSRGKVSISSSSGGATPGKFLKPIGAACSNGYHAWAVDCPANTGAAIYSAAAGTVTVAEESGWNGGYGKTIVIDHGNGWQTRYAHLNSINVNPGQRVGAGVVIAANGNTGRSTGPHLHWEIIKNGQRLNPQSYL